MLVRCLANLTDPKNTIFFINGGSNEKGSVAEKIFSNNILYTRNAATMNASERKMIRCNEGLTLESVTYPRFSQHSISLSHPFLVNNPVFDRLRRHTPTSPLFRASHTLFLIAK